MTFFNTYLKSRDFFNLNSYDLLKASMQQNIPKFIISFNFKATQHRKKSEMSELVLIPTPNWFTSKPIDICQTDGTIAFSAICSILLTKNLTETYNSTIKDAHAKRILSLSFYRGNYIIDSESARLLASCGEDMEVKVWNIKTGGLVDQHKLHQVSSTTSQNLKYSLLILR